MANRRRFKVYPIPNSSNESGEEHFAVRGPRVDEFAEQARIARLLTAALNAADEFRETSAPS